MFEPSDKIIAYISSPLGFIELISEGGFTTKLYFNDKVAEEIIPAPLVQTANQIKDYFCGELKTFNIPVNPEGSNFQLSVWKLLMEIPYGVTTTYGEIATKLGMKNGARAVGLANGSNPVSIIIPCHRVIGRKGNLAGYAGGLWRKEWLLKMELSALNVGLFRK